MKYFALTTSGSSPVSICTKNIQNIRLLGQALRAIHLDKDRFSFFCHIQAYSRKHPALYNADMASFLLVKATLKQDWTELASFLLQVKHAEHLALILQSTQNINFTCSLYLQHLMQQKHNFTFTFINIILKFAKTLNQLFLSIPNN